jgi:hypothetical protein
MATEAKQILSESRQSQKPLSLRRRGKPTHVRFSRASRFVRDFGLVVRIGVVDGLHRGHDRSMSCIIAATFVGDPPPWFPTLTGEPAAEQPFSRPLIAAALHEDSNAIAVLIAGASAILSLALNRAKDFVDRPRVA